jgi:cytochrome b subunit of formate dehydrogenase
MEMAHITALSTAIIAFVTVIGLMFGFYYNLQIIGAPLSYILALELVFLGTLWSFTTWIQGRMKRERTYH